MSCWLLERRCTIAMLSIAIAFSANAFAAKFVVEDIQLEGLQRVAAGTVFNYLPVQVGSTVSEKEFPEIIRALFKTGFFTDVRLEQKGSTLVVTVAERPAIGEIALLGNTDISTEDLKKSLKEVGLAEGQVFDRALLDKVEQELFRQYYNRGRYAVQVKSDVRPLERHRVGITISITEGAVASIRSINFVGNKAFKEKELRQQLSLSTGGLFSFFTKDDQYSKQKLAADIETLRSFYMDRGYLKFNVDSTQVSITPDKKDIYITVNLTEGEPYTVDAIQLSGAFGPVAEEELRKLVEIKSGDPFSRAKTSETIKAITDRLGEEGYALATVQPSPRIDDAAHKVSLNMVVDPGKRVYVRRIQFQGNLKTQDEVLRREMRQVEGAWFSTKDLDRSKTRLQRLDYLENVVMDTTPVPGNNEQVDVNFTVTERPSGSLMLGIGYGQESGVLLNISVVQNNFLGTGNQLGLVLNNSNSGENYTVSYNNPYYTADGVGVGFKAFYQTVDGSEINTANYVRNAAGGLVAFSFPLNEFDTLRLSPGYQHLWIGTTESTPAEVFSALREDGDAYDQWTLDMSWARDSRNRAIFPTEGSLHQIFGEIALPGSTAEFYKINYRNVNYIPLARWLTWSIGGELGYGAGYGSMNDLPFFENFFTGGLRSVRGFKANTLGPRYANDDPRGGAFKTVMSTQWIVPAPFTEKSDNVRLAAFIDAGNVFDVPGDFNVNNLRYSAGVSSTWMSPLGPLALSIAAPLNKKPGDITETFQFSFGVPLN